MRPKTYDLVGGVRVNQSEYAFKHAFDAALRKATDKTIALVYLEWTLYYAKHTDARDATYYNPRYLLRREVGRRQRERTSY